MSGVGGRGTIGKIVTIGGGGELPIVAIFPAQVIILSVAVSPITRTPVHVPTTSLSLSTGLHYLAIGPIAPIASIGGT